MIDRFQKEVDKALANPPKDRFRKFWAYVTRQDYVDIYLPFHPYAETLFRKHKVQIPFNMDSWRFFSAIEVETGYNNELMVDFKKLLEWQYGIMFIHDNRWMKFTDHDAKMMFVLTYSEE